MARAVHADTPNLLIAGKYLRDARTTAALGRKEAAIGDGAHVYASLSCTARFASPLAPLPRLDQPPTSQLRQLPLRKRHGALHAPPRSGSCETVTSQTSKATQCTVPRLGRTFSFFLLARFRRQLGTSCLRCSRFPNSRPLFPRRLPAKRAFSRHPRGFSTTH